MDYNQSEALANSIFKFSII